MNKLERLLDLIAALLDTERPVSRQEIRTRMPPGAYSTNDAAFRRTFERDKDELRALGLPLVVEAVPGVDPPVDGYRMDRKNYAAQIPELEPDELAALHLASNLVRLEGASGEDPFFELDSLDRGGAPIARVPGGKVVHDLLAAIGARQVLSFDYGGSTRLVEPHRLVFSRGHWYLLGYDKTRNDPRQFRVDRFESGVIIQEENFNLPDAIGEVREEPAWRYGQGEAIHVQLLADSQHAPWVIEHLGESSVLERRSDGSVVVEEEVRNPEIFRSFVLTFLEGAEILSPPELRRDICVWLEKLK